MATMSFVYCRDAQPPLALYSADAPLPLVAETASTAPTVVVPKVCTVAAPSQLDPDGNDDPVDTGLGEIPDAGHFERVGTPPLALTRICDLRPFMGSLYAAHANQPLGTDGATITRYTPVAPDAGGGRARSPFHIAFDWNRPGQPTEGGGAGQGFLRVRSIGGRL